MIKLFEEFEEFKEINEVKEDIFMKAIETSETGIVDFFISKGYNINDYKDALYKSLRDSDMFRHLLEKGANVENLPNCRLLRDDDIQKALIDNNYEMFIFDNCKFSYSLQYDSEYGDIIKLFNNMMDSGNFNFEKYKNEKELLLSTKKFNL
jgi:hypothetical protein